MAEDATYQTLVYSERDSSTKVFKSDGILRGHSGGIFSAESGYSFNLASQAILTKDIARVVHSQNEPVFIRPALGISVLAVSNLPKNQKYVTILGSTAMSKGSFWLTSCSAGAEVFLCAKGDSIGTFTNNNTSVFVSLSGCIVLGSVGAHVSSFIMYTSAASDNGVHLVAFADNVWSIVSSFGASFTEQNNL